MWDEFDSGIIRMFRAEALWRQAMSRQFQDMPRHPYYRTIYAKAVHPGPAYPAWLLGDEDQARLGIVKIA
jgi:hypothetical protein